MNKQKYNKIKEKALQQLKTGISLFGKDGALASLLQEFLQEALEAEMDAHLTPEQRTEGNKRNGRGFKKVRTSAGILEIRPPEDRKSNFQPIILPKRETILTDTLQEKIIGLYGLGMSSRDISKHLEEIYDTKISHNTLMKITDRIIPSVKAWQARPLDDSYPILYLDAMHQKIQKDSIVKVRAVYNILAINRHGRKEILGVYISETEGAKFWLNVLTNLQNRGVKDVLIVCTDNLKGFDKAIKSVFPKAELQTCIVHQIRNSLKYIRSKEQKAFMADLKKVYKATTKEMAEHQLTLLEEKWGKKYPIVIKSWQDNWHKLSTYFQYTEPIRRLIYTTNIIEGYHRQLRKVTKNKGVFPNDDALLKLIYLATKNIEKKWTKPIHDWCLVAQQLSIKFGNRMKLDLNLQ